MRMAYDQKQIENLVDLSNYNKPVKFNNTVTFDDTIEIGSNNDGIYFEEGKDNFIHPGDGLYIEGSASVETMNINDTCNIGDLIIEKDTGAEGGAKVDFQGTGTIILPSEVFVGSLPTSDPGVEGALYIDNGVLKVSQG